MSNTDIALSRQVEELIKLNHEGDYWDFKKQWHGNKAELLHDIICMANSPKNIEKYIIIGIDEENDFSIVDITNDTRRRNTANLNNFLRAHSFIGGVRPLVRVENIIIGKQMLDVIVIEDSDNTPFILAGDYSDGPHGRTKTVRQGNVYVRVGDTNTPLDKTADNDKVEALWRKRFHLDKTPLEKFNCYLRSPNDWSSDENRENFYHKYAPEYTVSFDYDQEELDINHDFLCKMYIDGTAKYSTASLKVYGPTIKHLDYASMDGGRFTILRPQYYSIIKKHDSFREDSLFMTYLIADSIDYGFYIFLSAFFRPIDNYQLEWWHEHVVLFRNNEEQLAFIEHVKDNFDAIMKKTKRIQSGKPIHDDGDRNYVWTEFNGLDWVHTKVLVEEFDKWHNSYNHYILSSPQ